MEQNRKQLLKEREELQNKLYMLQNRLLEDMADSVGNILENHVSHIVFGNYCEMIINIMCFRV